MDHALSLVAASLLCGLVSAQADLEARRDAKLAEPWVKAAPWVTDYDKALEQAQQSGKPVFAYVTRSYAP
jgi:hypothetical protein